MHHWNDQQIGLWRDVIEESWQDYETERMGAISVPFQSDEYNGIQYVMSTTFDKDKYPETGGFKPVYTGSDGFIYLPTGQTLSYKHTARSPPDGDFHWMWKYPPGHARYGTEHSPDYSERQNPKIPEGLSDASVGTLMSGWAPFNDGTQDNVDYIQHHYGEFAKGLGDIHERRAEYEKRHRNLH